jgi:hypothetical protein
MENSMLTKFTQPATQLVTGKISVSSGQRRIRHTFTARPDNVRDVINWCLARARDYMRVETGAARGGIARIEMADMADMVEMGRVYEAA